MKRLAAGIVVSVGVHALVLGLPVDRPLNAVLPVKGATPLRVRMNARPAAQPVSPVPEAQPAEPAVPLESVAAMSPPPVVRASPPASPEPAIAPRVEFLEPVGRRLAPVRAPVPPAATTAPPTDAGPANGVHVRPEPVTMPEPMQTSPSVFSDEASAPPTAHPASARALPALPAVTEARPLYRDNPPPPYPAAARRRGYTGTVLLTARVDAEGRVAALEVESSSGYPVLDRAALSGVRSWRFVPGTRGGRPVETRVTIPVRFELTPR